MGAPGPAIGGMGPGKGGIGAPGPCPGGRADSDGGGGMDGGGIAIVGGRGIGGGMPMFWPGDSTTVFERGGAIPA